jgi:hypothetical protein
MQPRKKQSLSLADSSRPSRSVPHNVLCPTRPPYYFSLQHIFAAHLLTNTQTNKEGAFSDPSRAYRLSHRDFAYPITLPVHRRQLSSTCQVKTLNTSSHPIKVVHYLVEPFLLPVLEGVWVGVHRRRADHTRLLTSPLPLLLPAVH